MTATEFNRINAKSCVQNGVNIVSMPFNPKARAIALIDGQDKYIFINSNLGEDKRPELIKEGFQKLSNLEVQND